MSRDPRLYLDDIVRACEKIGRYTASLDMDAFVADERTYDAVLRNLEVIGEATKRVPADIRDAISGVPWRAIAGFRDFVAHVYFALDDGIVWNAVRAEVPAVPRDPLSLAHALRSPPLARPRATSSRSGR